MRRASFVGAAGWVLRAFWLAALVVLVSGTVATRVGPLIGHAPFVIRSASMAPAVPVGSVVFASRTVAGDIVDGDIVTFRATNGVVVTHRVLESTVIEGEHLYRTKGDGNGAADEYLVPEGSLVGVVRIHVPLWGYLLALETQPAGLATFASGLIVIYLAILLLDERKLEERQRQADARPRGLPA